MMEEENRYCSMRFSAKTVSIPKVCPLYYTSKVKENSSLRIHSQRKGVLVKVKQISVRV
jgi:hypothetical protein